MSKSEERVNRSEERGKIKGEKQWSVAGGKWSE